MAVNAKAEIVGLRDVTEGTVRKARMAAIRLNSITTALLSARY